MPQKNAKALISLVVILIFALLTPVVLAEETTTVPDETKAPKKVHIQLTEEQKAQLIPLWEQESEVEQQIVQKKVELGLITQEQGDKMLERISKKLEMRKSNDYPMSGSERGKKLRNKQAQTAEN